MQELCRAHDALFVLDEVQTGCGMTGTPWAYQQLGLQPDVVAFGKKLQVCGIMAGGRVDEVPDNVFRVPSRINSTWGGNLTDMVRSRRQLEVIDRGRPDRPGRRARQAPARRPARRAPASTTSAGGGCSSRSTCPTPEDRAAVLRRLHAASACWCSAAASARIRLRPALTIEEDDLALAVREIAKAVAA